MVIEKWREKIKKIEKSAEAVKGCQELAEKLTFKNEYELALFSTKCMDYHKEHKTLPTLEIITKKWKYVLDPLLKLKDLEQEYSELLLEEIYNRQKEKFFTAHEKFHPKSIETVKNLLNVSDIETLLRFRDNFELVMDKLSKEIPENEIVFVIELAKRIGDHITYSGSTDELTREFLEKMKDKEKKYG